MKTWGDLGFTVVLLTPGFVARGDFDAQGQPREAPRGMPASVATADGASLLLAALALSSLKVRRVWVLSTLSPLVMVELPAGKLGGLESEERLSALAFETEALTGVPAVSSALGARLVRTDAEWEHWCAVQVARRTLQELETEAARKGGRIAGVLHPGGLPLKWPGASEPDQEWVRYEFWPETFVSVRNENSPLPLEVAHWDSQRAVDGAVPAARPGETMRRSLLLSPGVQPPRNKSIEVLALTNPENLAKWLSGWARVLLAPEPRAAVVRPLPAGMTRERRALISTVAAVATALLCVGHWALTEWQLARNTAALKDITARNKRREELQTSAAQISQLRKDLDDARRRHRQELEGFSELLAAMSEMRPEGLVVRSIRESNAQSRETLLTGLCERPELAGRFANALAGRLQKLGWEVRPAKQKAQLITGRPVWDFEIGLRLAAAATPGKPAIAARAKPQ